MDAENAYGIEEDGIPTTSPVDEKEIVETTSPPQARPKATWMQKMRTTLSEWVMFGFY